MRYFEAQKKRNATETQLMRLYAAAETHARSENKEEKDWRLIKGGRHSWSSGAAAEVMSCHFLVGDERGRSSSTTCRKRSSAFVHLSSPPSNVVDGGE